MNTDQKDMPEARPSSEAAGEVALQFVQEELAKTRTAVKRTKIISVVLLVFVASYMSFITVALMPYLSPEGAADTARDMIVNQIATHSPEITARLKQEVPELVAKIPDKVLEQMPAWRGKLEDKVEDILTQNLVQHSAGFGKQFDDFLALHQVELADLLQTTDDKEKLRVFMTSIEQDILEFMSDPMEDGESIKQKLNVSLETLSHIEKQMERLATAKDLSPQEKKTRRAIAVISRKVSTEKLAPPTAAE